MRTLATAIAALAAAVFLGGCAEVAQEPGKYVAGKQDTRPYAGEPYKGDKAKWEAAIAERSQRQDDYARMPADKK
jgi:hypothetical protein